MSQIKVAINGFGTIGKRVADAVDAQEDMIIIGVTKTGPSFGCELAVKRGFPLFCTSDEKDRIDKFKDANPVASLFNFTIVNYLRGEFNGWTICLCLRIEGY